MRRSRLWGASLKLSKPLKKRLWFYGSLLFLLVGGYFFQPVRYDFLARPIPSPNPPVDPESKQLFSKDATVMVVTAHPDDAEYYLSGFLLKLAKAGARIDLVVCTDGDKSYYLWQNNTGIRATRRDEQHEAAKHYHAHGVTFLAFPDGRLHPNHDVVAAIRSQIMRLQPRWLVTFDGDYPPKVSHGDHRSAGQAALGAARGTSVREAMLFATHAPNYTADISDTGDQQKALLAIHKSQFAGEKLEMVANTCLEAAMEDGERINATYGVSFRCIHLE